MDAAPETAPGAGRRRRELLQRAGALAGAAVAAPLAGCAARAGAPEAGAAAPSAAGLYPSGSAARPLPLQATSLLIPTPVTGVDAYPVYYRRTIAPDTPLARYPGFKPGRTVLKEGSVRREGALPLPCDIVFDRDVAVRMRDGVTIYADVFRPVDGPPVPAVLAFSPYGKEVGGQHFDDVPRRAGVPLAAVSELQRFEGPDPAQYVARGYAVVNPDPRGAYRSEGNIAFWGRQTAEDGHDIVEWAARQPWCSGKVGMAGNSWLAISQWFIAAERPPSLAAIAPWEGNSDYFRNSGRRGGIPFWGMTELLIKTFGGNGLVEDLPRMTSLVDRPTPYWQDKAAQLEKIVVPAYVVASYTHPGHTQGTFEGFRRIASPQKWLRVHNTGEWRDFNDPAHVADLLKFFDRFLKNQANGWEQTPRVRLSVLDPGGRDVVDRPEADWPLARQQHRPLYLAPAGALSETPPPAAGRVRYEVQGGSARFVLPMPRDTEITGYIKLRLWVEADGHDDMDLNVTVGKLGADGRPVASPPGPGGPFRALGLLRVSRRELDPVRSTPSEPWLAFGEPQALKPGEPVAVEIALWPIGLRLRAGEQLVLAVRAHGMDASGGSPFVFGEAKVPVPADGGTFPPGSDPPLLQLGAPLSTLPAFAREQHVPVPPPANRGAHVIHFGGGYDSHLLLPFIPFA